jgi:hypothetical protein
MRTPGSYTWFRNVLSLDMYIASRVRDKLGYRFDRCEDFIHACYKWPIDVTNAQARWGGNLGFVLSAERDWFTPF